MQPMLIPQKNTNTLHIKSDQYEFKDGDQLYFTVKAHPDNDQTDSDALIKAEWTVGEDATYGEEGYLELKLSETQTDIPAGDYFYDIKLANDEVKTTIIVGELRILPVATLRV